MADSDLTIVILRNIQVELVSINERLDSNDKQHEAHRESFAMIQQRFDVMGGQLAHVDNRLINVENRLINVENGLTKVENRLTNVDNRLANVEEIAVKTAASLGVDASSRHRVMRHDGDIAELKVRVTALETIVKGKPTL